MKNQDINTYLNSLPADSKSQFEQLWEAMCSCLPEAEQVICYGLPTLRLKNKNVIHAGAWKSHLALYPGAAAVKQFATHPDCIDHSKGSIRFPFGSQKLIPVALQLIEYRLHELASGR